MSAAPGGAGPAALTSTDRWPRLGQLDQRLETAGEAPSALFRAVLDAGDAVLRARFEAGEPVAQLVRARAALLDAVLIRAWQMHAAGLQAELALVAVGGYGRGVLHPASDVDVMVLVPVDQPDACRDVLERFVAFLWDLRLEVGHSARTVDDCEREARADITVATSLMESRLLHGSTQLYEQMQERIGPSRLWPADAFFEAKVREQIARHHRYNDTAYDLEPNVKGSPGGLRDIQMIGWVTQRHFGTRTLDELREKDFLTEEEYRSLLEGQAFLWRVRFALHLLAGRREDRLLFEHQVKLARMLGYEDATYTLAVEQLMQRYYRTVMELSRLNEMLLQMLREAILGDPGPPVIINERFQSRNGYLEVRDERVFERSPSALLELFLQMQQHAALQGVSAATIRLVLRHRYLVDESFRQDPRHHRMFLSLLRAPAGVTHELRRMNRYGLLGLYIPAFGRIVGRMQYDLFHAYTVDEHTLFVVSNLRRFALSRFDHEFPYCSAIVQSLNKPELAYLAALFHDIAKGRGGDHSELGAVDAEAFCLEQGLGRYDARLVAWLVRHHLLLSVTAQKKDISDPAVINEFARLIGDEAHLDYLYVLTVADVRGTNPKLWNSWKASLFQELYQQTRRALRRGLEHPIDREELIAETASDARRLLLDQGMAGRLVDEVWQRFTEEHFLRHSPKEIAWHTRLLAEYGPIEDGSLVAIRRNTERGGTAIFVHTRQKPDNFALVTGVLDELGLNILDARITEAANGYSLDTFVVLEETGEPDESRIAEIESRLTRALLERNDARITRRATRQVRMFSTPTRIGFSTDERNRRTVIELTAGDRPGLLSDVGKVFREAGVAVHAAKITTVGERAEDVFYITDERNQPLGENRCAELGRRLGEALDRNKPGTS